MSLMDLVTSLLLVGFKEPDSAGWYPKRGFKQVHVALWDDVGSIEWHHTNDATTPIEVRKITFPLSLKLEQGGYILVHWNTNTDVTIDVFGAPFDTVSTRTTDSYQRTGSHRCNDMRTAWSIVKTLIDADTKGDG